MCSSGLDSAGHTASFSILFPREDACSSAATAPTGVQGHLGPFALPAEPQRPLAMTTRVREELPFLGQAVRGRWSAPEEMGITPENNHTCGVKHPHASRVSSDPGSPRSDAISSGLRRSHGVSGDLQLSMALGPGRAGALQGLRSPASRASGDAGELPFLEEPCRGPCRIGSHGSQVGREIIIPPSSASRPGLTHRALTIPSQRGPGCKDDGSG